MSRQTNKKNSQTVNAKGHKEEKEAQEKKSRTWKDENWVNSNKHKREEKKEIKKTAVKTIKVKKGKVEWFNDVRGYGMIKVKCYGSETTIGVDYRSIIGTKTLREGQIVSFELSSKYGKEQAINVKIIKNVPLYYGTINWYNPWRNYGFITLNNKENGQVFFSQRQLKNYTNKNGIPIAVQVGDRVIFQIEENENGDDYDDIAVDIKKDFSVNKKMKKNKKKKVKQIGKENEKKDNEKKDNEKKDNEQKDNEQKDNEQKDDEKKEEIKPKKQQKNKKVNSKKINNKKDNKKKEDEKKREIKPKETIEREIFEPKEEKNSPKKKNNVTHTKEEKKNDEAKIIKKEIIEKKKKKKKRKPKYSIHKSSKKTTTVKKEKTNGAQKVKERKLEAEVLGAFTGVVKFFRLNHYGGYGFINVNDINCDDLMFYKDEIFYKKNISIGDNVTFDIKYDEIDDKLLAENIRLLREQKIILVPPTSKEKKQLKMKLKETKKLRKEREIKNNFSSFYDNSEYEYNCNYRGDDYSLFEYDDDDDANDTVISSVQEGQDNIFDFNNI